ncbi:MAG: 1,4-alpha-glucan branching enzyme, partial [Thaumarchaeota archaeon]|nr:1,4-alpha-glucan branching enzyme [Nitrososphaerota archaeon]
MQKSSSVSKEQIEAIVSFQESNPSSTLGPHNIQTSDGELLSIRAYLPRAVSAEIIRENRRRPMEKTDPRGFWEANEKAQPSTRSYTIIWKDPAGYENRTSDPYAFEPLLTDYDLHLFSEGTHKSLFEKMGAQIRKVNGIDGVNFAVWAPNARSISVVGNFNHWNIGEAPMNSRGASGVWELFVPGLDETEVYKFAIKSNVDGNVRLKTDPFAFATEVRPRTAALVAN